MGIDSRLRPGSTLDASWTPRSHRQKADCGEATISLREPWPIRGVRPKLPRNVFWLPAGCMRRPSRMVIASSGLPPVSAGYSSAPATDLHRLPFSGAMRWF